MQGGRDIIYYIISPRGLEVTFAQKKGHLDEAQALLDVLFFPQPEG
jgi:hypothetical protein